MKKNVWLVLVLALSALALVNAPPLNAQERVRNPGSITVTGDAEIKVAPHEVILILGVETNDKNIQQARKLNDERVKKVIALTKDFGIDPKYVQTDQINVEPRYRNGYYTDVDFIGYFVARRWSSHSKM